MDRKTLALLLTEALLIVVLVVVIAMDFNKPVETKIASHAPVVSEHKAADAEAPAEKAEKAHEEEAVEEAEEEAADEAEAKHEEEAPAEKHAEKAEPVKDEKHAEAPAAKEEKAEAAAPAAGGSTEVADVVAMSNPIYEAHKKGIVQFTHKKHNVEYKIGCGECHHDDKGKPLAELKMGDPVQDCAACHSKTGKPEKGIKGAEKRAYHMNAIHDNCIGCHKDYNKEKKTKAAPASCGKCHPKVKK